MKGGLFNAEPGNRLLGTLVGIGVAAFAVMVFLLPEYLGPQRNSAQLTTILGLGLSFGGALFGWVAAMVWGFWPREPHAVAAASRARAWRFPSVAYDRHKSTTRPAAREPVYADPAKPPEIVSITYISYVLEVVLRGGDGAFFAMEDRASGSFVQGIKDRDGSFLLDVNNKEGLTKISDPVLRSLAANGWERDDEMKSLFQKFG